MTVSTITKAIPSLDYLCFECPRCRCERIQIEAVQGDYKIACRLCRMVFRSWLWFNGETWLNELIEELR